MAKKLLTADERYNLYFDQFGRYQTIAAIINANRSAKKLRILDVGGLDGHIADFLPDDEVTILDVLPGEGENYIQGDALHMDFADNSFDVVMSSDTLEHISAKDRVAFVAESWRVAKDFLIVAAPFDTPGAAAAELRADAVYKALAGTSYRWLEEHIANGLPSATQLMGWIQDNKLSYLRLSNNPLDEWYALMTHFFVLDNLASDAGRENLRSLTRAYNQKQVFTEASDTAYRQFFAIAKTKLKAPALPAAPKDTVDVIGLESLARTLVGYRALEEELRAKKDLEIKHLAKENDAKERHLQAILSSKSWKLAHGLQKTKAKLWRN